MNKVILVGKGPSLDRPDFAEMIRAKSPTHAIFTINESIHRVEEVAPLDARMIHVVQQDWTLKDRCVPKRPTTVHLMNCYQDGAKVSKSPWNPSAILYDPCDFGCDPCTLSAVIALHIAAKFELRESVVFSCFDSWRDGASGGSCEYADSIGTKSGEFVCPERHRVHKAEIMRAYEKLGFKSKEEWTTPL
jgi:hypothetical protein